MIYKPLTKRAREALEILQAHSDGIHSFKLANLMRWDTNFVPRAISEARDAGYDISSAKEKMGDAWGVRYTFISGPTFRVRSEAQMPKKVMRLVFNPERETYQEVEVEELHPATVIQGGLGL